MIDSELFENLGPHIFFFAQYFLKNHIKNIVLQLGVVNANNKVV